jgi:hypothetical protein
MWQDTVSESYGAYIYRMYIQLPWKTQKVLHNIGGLRFEVFMVVKIDTSQGLLGCDAG